MNYRRGEPPIPPATEEPVAAADPGSLSSQQEGSAARLEWISVGKQGFEATGSHGTWRIKVSGRRWYLSIQPTFTRGMLARGKFRSPEDAQARAQSSEDDEAPPRPQYVRATGPTDPATGKPQ